MRDEAPTGQRWPDCDRVALGRINSVTIIAREVLGDAYIGTYLYGSLATGCYYPPKSDIDLLVIVAHPLTAIQRQRIARAIAMSEDKVQAVGGVEVSVITRGVTASPTPASTCEIQYSPDRHHEVMTDAVDWSRPQPDEELAAHLMVATRRGAVVEGPPISEVFGPVRWDDYVQAVLEDFEWITTDDHIIESPFYGVLNVCRTLDLLIGTEQRVLSKEEGAVVALANLPAEHHPIIEQALEAYRSSAAVLPEERRTNGEAWDRDALRAFVAYARSAASTAVDE